MPNLQNVNVGMNKFCGPAVLSTLTGKDTDECAYVISRINGAYKVEGVTLGHLLMAADKLGFRNEKREAGCSMYLALTKLVNEDGMYIFTLPNHFVAIEVADKKIYFCDNHTKQIMPAQSSARMLQKVLSINKVFPKPPAVLLRTDYTISVRVTKTEVYDNPDMNRVSTDTKYFDSKLDLINFVQTLDIK